MDQTLDGAEVRFVIKGQCKSGKNHMQISRTGRHFPLKSFVDWRSGVEAQIMAQVIPRIPLEGPCKARFWYFPGDLRRRDVPGMIDALFHVFERMTLVKDDSLIKDVTWTTWPLDRINPRVIVELAPTAPELGV